VESEYSALSVCCGASTAGARVFTATSANGMAYMHEVIHWAAGSRLPIVMACVNRAVAAPWNILNDQQDSISQRDTGWIQMYARNNQEVLDLIIQAYRIAETVYLPIMVCFDGYILSHTVMPVAIPRAEDVANFLPPYKPHTVIDPHDPRNYNLVTLADPRPDASGVLCHGYMELRYLLQEAMEKTLPVIDSVDNDFGQVFGRRYGGSVWSYKMEGARLVLVAMGSLAMEATVAADMLREQGFAAGVMGLRVYRPFPGEAVRRALSQAEQVLVFDKNISYGYQGATCADIKAALYNEADRPSIHNFIVGLGGRDVKARELTQAAAETARALSRGDSIPQTRWLCQI
jgi:pyruvate ferredoxin oxidoreductase alpha subunit